MSNNMHLSKPLLAVSFEAEIVAQMISSLKRMFPDTNKINGKGKIELILEILKTIGNYTREKRIVTVNKRRIFFDIYIGIFGAVDERETEYLNSIVDFLYTSNQVKLKSRASRFVEFITKKHSSQSK